MAALSYHYKLAFIFSFASEKLSVSETAFIFSASKVVGKVGVNLLLK